MTENHDIADKVHAYLEGNLAPDARLDFELELQNDPVLRSEFEVQKDIINALKSYRTAELKAALDTIEIGSWVGIGFFASAWKLAGAAIVATGLTVGTVNTIQNITGNGTANAIVTLADLQESPAPILQPVKPNVPLDLQLLSRNSGTKNTDKAPVAQSRNNSASQQTPVKTQVEATSTPKQVANPANNGAVFNESAQVANNPAGTVVVPDLAGEPETELQRQDSNPAPAATPGKEAQRNKQVDIVKVNDSGFNFHYRFVEDKLFLYGKFAESPYEIFELNTADGKDIFMYYEGGFYLLDQFMLDITPLKKVKNRALVKKLQLIKQDLSN